MTLQLLFALGFTLAGVAGIVGVINFIEDFIYRGKRITYLEEGLETARRERNQIHYMNRLANQENQPAFRDIAIQYRDRLNSQIAYCQANHIDKPLPTLELSRLPDDPFSTGETVEEA